MHVVYSKKEKIPLTFPNANRYLIGYSGGRDSHVLLDLLCRLRDSGELTTPITAIHVNHNLQSQSSAWAAHCRAICDGYNIPLLIETVTEKPKAGDSVEAFAREARYRLIEQHLSEGDVFLSAHHQRDQAETFLLQLMRGAGLEGLKSMPVERALGAGRYVRPLLDVAYADILAYAEEKQLDFIVDNSNDDRRFDRNYIRHEVLPVLQNRFPKAVENIAQSAKWLAEVPPAIAPQQLFISELLGENPNRQKQQIRAFVKGKTSMSLSQTQTQYILAHHLNAGADKHPTLAVGDFVVRRYADALCVTATIPDWRVPEQALACGQALDLSPIGRLSWQSGQGLLLNEQLQIKALRGGDRFHPHDRNRATNVKKYLNEKKIPYWLRRYYFGLYLHNELVAIPGVAVERRYYQKTENAQLPMWKIDDKFVRI